MISNLASTLGGRLDIDDVAAQIGEGGIRQMSRVRDTKLERDVNNVLPEVAAPDADRLTASGVKPRSVPRRIIGTSQDAPH